MLYRDNIKVNISVKLTSNLKKYQVPQTPFIADKRENFVDQRWNLFMMLSRKRRFQTRQVSQPSFGFMSPLDKYIDTSAVPCVSIY